MEDCIRCFFLDENTGYAVGFEGVLGITGDRVVFTTTDGGISWSYQLVGEGIINSIYFINDSVGYAVGYSLAQTNILKTVNGGITWNLQTHNPGPGIVPSFNSVIFVNDSLGFIVGHNGAILYTENGGALRISEMAINQNKFCVFPNPTTDITNINFEFESPGTVILSIQNNFGQVLKEVPIGFKRTGNFVLNCNEFLSGIYFITLKTDSGILTEKLIIE